MRPLILKIIPLVFLLACGAVASEEPADQAKRLAQDVWKASGGESWSKVNKLRFTFVVEEDGRRLAVAEHDWDLKAGTDHVKWKGKEATVNLAAPPQDEDGKAAYARWVNDSYWLLAPLKVLDPGVKLEDAGSKEMEDGACEMLRLSFGSVGLTPSDQYVLYIDPATKLVRSWDYIPKADTVMHGTWEKYETFGGLKLATEHNFGGKMIRFENVNVEAGE